MESSEIGRRQAYCVQENELSIVDVLEILGNLDLSGVSTRVVNWLVAIYSYT